MSRVGVRSPVKAESRWTMPALLEEAGIGPMSSRVLSCSLFDCRVRVTVALSQDIYLYAYIYIYYIYILFKLKLYW